MALTDFAIIRRSLWTRLFSTVTTVLTVAVAVALMLVLLSMRDAGRKAFSRGPGNMHILVSADASPLVSVLNSVFYAKAPQRAIPFARFKEIAADPRIDFAVPIQQGDSYRGFPTLATTPEFFTRFRPEFDRPWEFASGGAFSNDSDVIVGSEAARVTGLRVGDKLVVTHGQGAHGHGHEHDEHPYKVVGILKPTGSPHDRAVFITLNSTWLIHADEKRHDKSGDKAEEPTLENLTNDEKLITGVYIGVRGREGSGAPPLAGAVFADLRRDPSLTVALPSREIDSLFTIVGNIDRIIIGIALVVLLSSGITIMLALYNSMDQRRRQIAILRVLGASGGRIFGLVLTESAVIGLLGAALGVVLALVGGAIVAGVLRERLGLVIEAGVEPVWGLIVFAGATMLACIAGIIPAVGAYQTPVVHNLRPHA